MGFMFLLNLLYLGNSGRSYNSLKRWASVHGLDEATTNQSKHNTNYSRESRLLNLNTHTIQYGRYVHTPSILCISSIYTTIGYVCYYAIVLP